MNRTRLSTASGRPAPLALALLAPALLALALTSGCGDKEGSNASATPPATTPATATGATTPAPDPSQATSKEAIAGFAPNTDYLLEVDGKPVADARFYNKETPMMILVSSAGLPAPVLLNPRAASVETLDPQKVVTNADGSVDLAAEAVAKNQGTFQAGEDVRFTVDGHTTVLKSRPPLLGAKKAADLEAYSPIYDRGAASYLPNGPAMAALKAQTNPILVKIYFGSWCPHCKQEVPKAVRVERDLAGSSVHFEYFGLPQGFGSDPEAVRVKVDSVPTAVVYVAGREVGRINGSSWAAPEIALRDLLASAPAS
jgi:thiol-disulfide isomerase/thioredoxin